MHARVNRHQVTSDILNFLFIYWNILFHSEIHDIMTTNTVCYCLLNATGIQIEH